MNFLDNVITAESKNRLNIIVPLLDTYKYPQLFTKNIVLKQLTNKILKLYKNKTVCAIMDDQQHQSKIKKIIVDWIGNPNDMVKEIKHTEKKLLKITLKNYLSPIMYYFIDADLSYCKLLIKRLDIMINLVTTTKKQSARQLNIYTFPSKLTRTLIKNKFTNIKTDLNILQQKSMALSKAGETTLDGSTIFATKQEGLPRLLIHELCHWNDFEKINDGEHKVHRAGDKIENIISNWCVSPDKLGGSFEAYTELLSNIYSSIILYTELILLHNQPENLDSLDDILQIEMIYSIYDVAKLLYLYGYTKDNFELFFYPNKSDTKCNKVWAHVSIIYYYIVRSMLFIELNTILDEKYIDPSTLKIKIDYLSFESTILNKILGDKKHIYWSILNESFKILSINEKETSRSMEYSCIDINPYSKYFDKINNYINCSYNDLSFENKQTGGSDNTINYIYKYIKYKKKYLNLKKLCLH